MKSLLIVFCVGLLAACTPPAVVEAHPLVAVFNQNIALRNTCTTLLISKRISALNGEACLQWTNAISIGIQSARSLVPGIQKTVAVRDLQRSLANATTAVGSTQ